MSRKLNSGEKHFLRLIDKSSRAQDGWARVSATLMPLVKQMPAELVEWEATEDGRGRTRLTAHGNAVLEAMDWL